MKFQDKYAPDSEKTSAQHKDKKIIGDDTFALAEAVLELAENIERLRRSLI